jgi:hypothetical protein
VHQLAIDLRGATAGVGLRLFQFRRELDLKCFQPVNFTFEMFHVLLLLAAFARPRLALLRFQTLLLLTIHCPHLAIRRPWLV